MPHCIIEYSEDLSNSINEIMKSVEAGAVNSGLFEFIDIKIRAIPYKYYQVGITDSSFVHVSSRILSGRNSTQKDTLNAAIISQLSILTFSNCSITSEVIDIHKESYAKLEV
ncbi:5-carboxymethyl-2-hydroxymuconate Delta-isomerase [bacterium]|nr:5-carboxymethyl-2-hydroxymuconate Delta-isomerase [bacterium]